MKKMGMNGFLSRGFFSKGYFRPAVNIVGASVVVMKGQISDF